MSRSDHGVLSIGLLDALRMWKPEMPVSSTEGKQLMETQARALDTVKASMVLWEVLWPGTVDVMDHPELGAERFKVRQILDALMSSNVLRDVRDVQAETLEQYADERWGAVGKRRKEDNSMFGEELRIRERARVIREARSER